MMSKKPGKNDDQWLEAKRRCRLSNEEIRMAKELGIQPRGLIKNIPAKSQPWKAPVGEWIRDLYAKRFGEFRGPGMAASPDESSRRPATKAGSARIPGQISQPKGRITVESVAEVTRRIKALGPGAKVELCDELAVSQPEALGWVVLLPRQGVSMPVVDHVIHLLLVISESINKVIRRPLPRITEDDIENAAAKVHAMFMLLRGESKEEAAWLTYLMAEAHPERNLYAYVVSYLNHESKASERPGDEQAIYATAVLLDAFLQAAGLIEARASAASVAAEQ